jgi:protein-tyrosine phosphatase
VTASPRPIPASYWLIEGKLLAGEYPATFDRDRTRERLARFLDAGIRTFINLTETSESLLQYDEIARELAEERGVETKHLRFAIADHDVPGERDLMVRILQTIRDEIAADRPVYVHCWGGVGRTGTVIGCWLVEDGLAGEDAIAKIAELRSTTGDSGGKSPETDGQCRYICDWLPRTTRNPKSD